MTAPGPPMPVTGPTLAYTPQDSGPLVEATKDLLLFMRTQGFRCGHLEVTDKGVLLHELVDDYPSKAMPWRDQASAPPPMPPGLSYETGFPDE